ncbi:MAG: C1 family peptidase [Sulfuricella sp.]|nr:C1 family peptidase [Sulfuricella sp.]
MAKGKTRQTVQRVYNVRPDTMDFRDKMYEATLIEVPKRIALEDYRKVKVPILDQGAEGACTGFGLATVTNYLLRKRKEVKGKDSVSPRMMYEMAKRYDEWPGEKYDGSSARGAMKGWHKHGVCSESLWRYDPKKPDAKLTETRIADAANRPLGAYFRVNHKDLVAMHAALAEVGILYATATVHAGWEAVSADGVIPLRDEILGGHAFAIVAFDERGFWIQNSWGPDWGHQGFALVSYQDWLGNGTDIWVARLGAPVMLEAAAKGAAPGRAGAMRAKSYSYPELRPHIISIGNDGALRDDGIFGTSAAEAEEIIKQDFPRITRNWKKKRLLLYAHGGLVSEESAIQRVSDYRKALLDAEVYPLAFSWKSDAWTTIKNIIEDAHSRRRPEGILDAAKDFMLDRLDDALEPLARTLGGRTMWSEMKENALFATLNEKGGARIALGFLDELLAQDPGIEIHIAGHSAGSIFHAHIVQLLTAKGKITSGPLSGMTGLGRKIETCTLWAPACTVDLFKQTYLPALNAKGIKRFALFTLTDQVEQDDNCANIYHKSLLYLVSDAFEQRVRIPVFQKDGEPILGMEKFVRADAELDMLFKNGKADWVRSPNTAEDGSPVHSTARHHGDFDDDKPTVLATLARILGRGTAQAPFEFARTPASLRARRLKLG